MCSTLRLADWGDAEGHRKRREEKRTIGGRKGLEWGQAGHWTRNGSAVSHKYNAG